MTFLRFFGVFVGMSEPGADVPLSWDGDALLAAVDLSVMLPWSVLLDAVAAAAAEPLEVCVSSVINDGAARVRALGCGPGSTRVLQRWRSGEGAGKSKSGRAGQPPGTLDGGTARSVAAKAGGWSDVSSAREC